ncbi:MAG TPA: hypothetical protein VJ279_08560 [Hanamia sp.]|jgi:hypothetical protein|nr:hypothetical protein [Hanamia sp.]
MNKEFKDDQNHACDWRDKYDELYKKYTKTIYKLKTIALGNTCICSNGCAKCDASDILIDLEEFK